MFTLSQLTDWLQPNEGGADEELILRIEAVAIGLIEQAVDMVLSPARVVTHILDGTDSDVLWLPEVPASGATITVEYRFWGGTWESFASGGYELSGRQLLYLSGEFLDPSIFAGPAIWRSGRANWRVSYSAGYADADVPAALKQAVLDVITFLYRPGRQSLSLEKAAGSGWESLPSVKSYIELTKRPVV